MLGPRLRLPGLSALISIWRVWVGGLVTRLLLPAVLLNAYPTLTPALCKAVADHRALTALRAPLAGFSRPPGTHAAGGS